LRRRMGQERAISPHPCLDSILERTLGVPLFQEQVMQIAMVGAGYSPGEAYQLRRDMSSWKKHGRLERHRERLLQGFSKKGISARFSEQLFAQIQGFGEYGFPESHAASFALLVYASAYLKVHQPAAFCCAILNSQPMGFYSPSSLVQDAQRHGVEVRPVCVTVSTWDHTLEEDGALRLGMRLVKGFGAGPAVAIEEARADGPFTGVADVVRRASLQKNEVEALAEAGALEALVTNRREALWRARAPKVDGLFEALPIEEEKDVGLPKLRQAEQLVLDYGRLGLSLQDHPMRHYRARLDLQKTLTAEGTKSVDHGTTVRVAGLVIGRQRPATASGVTFFTLEDETGVVNVIVWAKLFEENYAVARYSKIMAVVGRLEKQGPIIHVLAEKLERLDAPGKRGVGTKSRDFH
jgi:error-prone DNA polymerase